MATLEARQSADNWESVQIANAQTGNGVSTNVADRGTSHKVNGTVVKITTAVGATPTCTYQIEVSADGTTWGNATYADQATPTSDSSATFVITTSTIVRKIIKHPTPWRYVRVTMSANTNVTNTIDVEYNDFKKFA